LSGKVLSNHNPLWSVVSDLEVEVFGVVHMVVCALSEVTGDNFEAISVFVVEVEVLLRLLLTVFHLHV
jgi:hypothetical protein